MGRRIRKAVYWQDAPIVREQGTTEHTEHTEARHNRATIPFRVFRVFRGSEKRDSGSSPRITCQAGLTFSTHAMNSGNMSTES